MARDQTQSEVATHATPAKAEPAGTSGADPAREAAEREALEAAAHMVVAKMAASLDGAATGKPPTPKPLPAGAEPLPAELIEQCRAAVRAYTHPELGTPQFEETLDEHTDSTSHTGDAALLLASGMQSFAERPELIRNARHSIELQTYIWEADETGHDVANQLIEAAKRNVRVRVIYDALCHNSKNSQIFAQMQSEGVEVREYKPPIVKFNKRWHEKHLIVDGVVSIEGGMNIADEYAYGGTDKQVAARPAGHKAGWRDADVEVVGATAKDAQAAFYRNWDALGEPVSREEAIQLLTEARAELGGDAIRAVPVERARFIQHHPTKDKENRGENAYVLSINAARSEILIESPYFIPTDPIERALIMAAARGVIVRVRTDSREVTDGKPVADASRYKYKKMMAAGVQIEEEDATMLHSKTMTIDGKLSIVGSLNLDPQSVKRNTEDVVLIEDECFAEEMRQNFAAGEAGARVITADELRSRGVWRRMREWANHLFAPFY